MAKRKVKVFVRVANILAVISLIGFLITIDISLFFTNTYFQIFWKDKDFGKISQIIDFFKGREVDFLNERELSHLKDVKRIVDILAVSRNCFLVIFAFSVSFLHVKKDKIEIKYAAFALLFLSLCLLLVSPFFDDFFISFHEIFFPQGNWEFLASSELIRLFPRDFWFAVFIHLDVLMLLEGIMLYLISLKSQTSSCRNK